MDARGTGEALAVALAALGRGDVDEAIDELSRALGRAPGDLAVHLLLARVLLAVERPRAALRHLRAAHGLDPAGERGLVTRTELDGAVAVAVLAWGRTLAATGAALPAELHDAIGWYLERLGDHALVVARVESALRRGVAVEGEVVCKSGPGRQGALGTPAAARAQLAHGRYVTVLCPACLAEQDLLPDEVDVACWRAGCPGAVSSPLAGAVVDEVAEVPTAPMFVAVVPRAGRASG